MKKVMIAGVSSSSGKTTIALGLMKLLADQGLKVQPYKVGPDYVDTAYHTRITKRLSRNLDQFLVKKERLSQLFEKEAKDSELCIIEGVMGLFDGLGADKDCCSSAGVAKQLNCPVVLVVDGRSASTSVAAVVKGFLDFDPDLLICGVIVNKVASENHFQLIKKAIETYTSAEVFGYLKRDPDLYLPSRQLGLVPDSEVADVMEKIKQTADSLAQTLDWKRLLEVLTDEKVTGTSQSFPQFSELTVAYAYDEAFRFYYPDNLELFELHGAALLPFSPMKDRELPEADLYYFGGGYPEEFAEELSENISMRQSVFQKHEADGFILAECGGLMYLGRGLEAGGKVYEMAGIFNGISRMTKGLQRFGYAVGVQKQDTLTGKRGEKIVGHEFHHSIFESAEPPVMDMYKERDGEIVNRWQGGYQKRNTFASYLHLHFYQEPEFLTRILAQVKESREKNG